CSEFAARIRLCWWGRKEEQCDGTVVNGLSQLFELAKRWGIAARLPRLKRGGLLPQPTRRVLDGESCAFPRPAQDFRVEAGDAFSHGVLTLARCGARHQRGGVSAARSAS